MSQLGPRFAIRIVTLLIAAALPACLAPQAHAQIGTVKTIAIATDAYNGLMQASDGNFYTATSGLGGCADNSNNNCAAIYRITPSGTITVLHQFQESNASVNANVNADGLSPTSLIEGADGNLYGTCAYGGPASYGTIFKLTFAGKFTLLYSFGIPAAAGSSVPTMSGGYQPQALIQGIDGDLYGVTPFAVEPSQSSYPTGGLFFRITTAGVFTPLHYFSPYSPRYDDGTGPNGLVQGDDGNFYVTMAGGVNSGLGAIDKVTPAGDATVWYNFAADYSQGAAPQGPLVEGHDGYLYGVSESTKSATSKFGNAFKVNASGTFLDLHNFTGGSDGGYAQPPLFLASDGNFYAGAIYGGDLKCAYGLGYGCGDLFQLTPSGGFNPFWDFEGGLATSTIVANNPKVFGAHPNPSLVQSTGGIMYGITEGGYESNGTFYTLTMKTPIPAPIQLTFNPTSVATGDETTLTWKVLNAFSKTAQLCSGHVAVNPEGADGDGVWNNVVQSGKLVNGVFTGTAAIKPTAAGAYTFALTCGGTETGFATLLVTGTSPLKIQTTSVPKATVGKPYQVIFGADGGINPYYWIEDGALPKGLTFDQATGILSGKPVQFGNYSFNVGVKDSSDPPLTDAVGISMSVVSSLTLSSTLPQQRADTPYLAQLDAAGGVPPYSFKLISGAFPPGFKWNPVNGVLSGTATETGKYTFVIEASDNEDPKATVQQTFVLPTIGELKIITPEVLPSGTLKEPYSVALAATGGVPPYTWAYGKNGYNVYKVPAGLTVSNQGALSGTPLQSVPEGSYLIFNVEVSDSGNPKATVSTPFEVYIKSTLKITTDKLPDGRVGTTTIVPLTATGGIPPYTWKASSVPNPTEVGIYIDQLEDGWVLEYLPIVATTANVTLYLEDAESDPAQVNLALPLTLLPALIATKTALTSSAASVTTGQSVTFTATVTIPTGGTAGGTVSFFNGTTLLGSATLNAKGVATLTTTFSTAGTDKITASYNGTTTYAPSKSGILTETITAKK